MDQDTHHHPAAKSTECPAGKFACFVDTVFLKHPREAGEQYPEHLLFTLRVAFHLIVSAFCAILHGLFPMILTTATSDRVRKLNEMMQERKARFLAKAQAAADGNI